MNFKKILSTLMAFILLFTSINLPVSAASDSFDDVKGHWAEKNINWSQEKGLVKGYPDGEFKPEGKITKAEFITIINNFMKAEKGRDFKFKDVKKSDWYYEEVRKAVNYYLQDEDYFRGDEYINRDEASKLIAAAYGLKEVELNKFKDSDEIVNKGAVGSLVAAKILNGYPDGTFKPKNSITRAEASKIFNVAYDNIGTPTTNNAQNPNKEEKVEAKSNILTSEKNIKNHRNSSSSHHHNSSNDNSNDSAKPMYPIGPSEPVNPGEETKTLEQIKSEAKNKIDDLKNLSDDEKKIIKEKIDTATTEKEVDAIVKEAKDKNDKENNEDKKDSVKFGVISDIHLDPNNERQVERTAKALNFFEENGAASSFIVGDVTNNGLESQYKEYEKVKKARAGSEMEVHASMGNHEGGTRNLFTKYYGDEPNAHYKINGYNFITVSPDGNGWSGNYSNASKWLSEELKKAKADTGDKPIFVFFHHPIKDTFYVSDEWYGDIPKNIFNDYPMAVTFSGHIHSPNNHPRSIWQDKFTAVNTVSLYYFEMESGYNNGSTYPKNKDLCAQGMLIEADGTKVTIKNRDFISDNWIDETWTFDTAHPEDFPYTDKRYNEARAPKFEEGTVVKVTDMNISGKDASVNLEFNQAKVDPESVKGDIVHSYEFEIKENDKVVKTVKDWSGFYLIPMPQKMNMKLDDLKANTKYTVDIYPVDAFKKKGDPITVTFTTSTEPSELNEDLSNENIDLKLDKSYDENNLNKDFEEKEFSTVDKEDSFKDISKNFDEEDANNLEESSENNSNEEIEMSI